MIRLAWLLFRRTQSRGNNGTPRVLIPDPSSQRPSLTLPSGVRGLEQAKAIRRPSWAPVADPGAALCFPGRHARLISKSSGPLLPSGPASRRSAGGAGRGGPREQFPSHLPKRGAPNPSHPPPRPVRAFRRARMLAAIRRVTSVKPEAQRSPSGETTQTDVRETAGHRWSSCHRQEIGAKANPLD